MDIQCQDSIRPYLLTRRDPLQLIKGDPKTSNGHFVIKRKKQYADEVDMGVCLTGSTAKRQPSITMSGKRCRCPADLISSSTPVAALARLATPSCIPTSGSLMLPSADEWIPRFVIMVRHNHMEVHERHGRYLDVTLEEDPSFNVDPVIVFIAAFKRFSIAEELLGQERNLSGGD